MTSDGYRLTLESVRRDAKEETRKEYESRLWERDREIERLKRRISELEHKVRRLESDNSSYRRKRIWDTLDSIF